MAADDFLCPMLIYEGKAVGLIARMQGGSSNNTTPRPFMLYACQAAAWMDKVCMLRWIEEVLKPYLAINPPPSGIIPIILLDAY